MSLPINIEDLLHRNKVESNRDFLKELDLTEGRCTGIPTIQDGLAKNGSPRASIETDEERSYFLMFIPVGKSSVSCPLKPSDSAPLKHSTMPP